MIMFPVLTIFIKSILLGLGVSVPPGPNAMLMINRTLRKGHFSGFMTGLGMATAEIIFAFVAFMGFTYVTGFISRESFWIRVVAGLLVAAIGLRLFLSNPAPEIRARMRMTTDGTPVQDFFSVFLMALLNPFSIFVFMLFFPGIDSSFTGNGIIMPAAILTGIFVGASLWWYILSLLVSRFSSNIRLKKLVYLTRGTGMLIVITGLVLLLTLFMPGCSVIP